MYNMAWPFGCLKVNKYFSEQYKLDKTNWKKILDISSFYFILVRVQINKEIFQPLAYTIFVTCKKLDALLLHIMQALCFIVVATHLHDPIFPLYVRTN